MSWKISLFSTVIALFLMNPLLAANDDRLLARTDKYEFKYSDLDRFIANFPPQVQSQLKESKQQQIVLVGKIMQQKVISELARKEKFDQSQEMKEKLAYIVDDLIANEYLQMVKTKAAEGVKLTDDDLRQYYHANIGMFTIPEQVRVRHILIRVPKGAPEKVREEAREKAKGIHTKLKAGDDFEKLAAQYSEDEATKAKKGDLGSLIRGQMEKPFEEAAFSLKPGEYSYIVETSQGYHIIFSEAHTQGRTKTFDETKDFIDKNVRERIAGEMVKDFVKKATQDAGLEIYGDKGADKAK